MKAIAIISLTIFSLFVGCNKSKNESTDKSEKQLISETKSCIESAKSKGESLNCLKAIENAKSNEADSVRCEVMLKNEGFLEKSFKDNFYATFESSSQPVSDVIVDLAFRDDGGFASSSTDVANACYTMSLCLHSENYEHTLFAALSGLGTIASNSAGSQNPNNFHTYINSNSNTIVSSYPILADSLKAAYEKSCKNNNKPEVEKFCELYRDAELASGDNKTALTVVLFLQNLR